MKDKAFAASVCRDNIRQCAEAGLELDDFLALAIEAMRRKEMQCYYIDKESKLICAARSDVSGAAQDGK